VSRKKKYIKPKIKTQKVFETAALACGKCLTGPIRQLACRAVRRVS